MDDSKKIKLLILISIFLLSGLVFYQIDTQSSVMKVHNVATFHDELLKNGSDQPRILIAGGSNALCGISSEEISRELGRPTLNIALPMEGYSRKNMLALIQSVAKPGDLIIYSTIDIYGINDDHGKNAHILSQELAANNNQFVMPDKFNSFVNLHWLPKPNTSIFQYLYSLARHQASNRNDWYSLDGYNYYGDFIAVKDAIDISPVPFKNMISEHDAFVKELETFDIQMKTRGITIVYSYPWIFINEQDRAPMEKQLKRLTKAINAFGGIVADEDSHNILKSNSSYFADISSHLKREFAKDRAISIGRAIENSRLLK